MATKQIVRLDKKSTQSEHIVTYGWSAITDDSFYEEHKQNEKSNGNKGNSSENNCK